MARPRAGSHFVRGQKRLTAWSGLAAQGYVFVADAGATLLSSIDFETSGTIVRARGQISIQPTSFAADENIVGAFGVGVVSVEARAVGVTAIPEPFSDADWGGWMVWTSFSYHFEFGSSVGQQFPNSVRIDIDSKAMRKVEPNSSLVFVVESFEGAFLMSEQVRVLQMLA